MDIDFDALLIFGSEQISSLYEQFVLRIADSDAHNRTFNFIIYYFVNKSHTERIENPKMLI